MTQDEFNRALDGISAYDLGAVDSGIRDEALRARLKAALHGPEGLSLLSVAVRDLYLSDEAMAQGYSVEDVRSVIQWLVDYMEFDL